MIVINRVPVRTFAVIGLALAITGVAPRSSEASADPVWSLLTTLVRGVFPDDPTLLSDDAILSELEQDDSALRRVLDDGVKLAQQPVQMQPTQTYQVQPPQTTYAPQYYYYYPTPAPVAGYQTVQNTVNAAVTYWTGQQPAQPTAAAAPQPAAAPAASQGDPHGFTAWLNGIRSQYGLAPVAYDENLSAWANMNNAQQNSRGLGHHVMGPARRQNSAMGSAASIGAQWLASPAHAAALLDPSIRVIGIAGMGAYWTFNAY
ncbi:CAP domain-containing protein [Tautonia rosea]|uniref:CAP domain-containing protein n=1 Tax=Tautonia rosea TaxID=2728037 RepID=UPI001473ABC5|nr:CAP domain-containing protein [Tautonia rosea]